LKLTTEFLLFLDASNIPFSISQKNSSVSFTPWGEMSEAGIARQVADELNWDIIPYIDCLNIFPRIAKQLPMEQYCCISSSR